ncbi:pentapeptide repeat-containing protein [Dictyobacter arantiisoli]|uniref:Pentapeptide repeat-containing protein n=1 Tax=Dictyobacter arantiisoli TaxID=2014874 RepID=A0A5A5T846_9CHLR|nr:pentapeptide repeat-containing protein [Dictyobacter arantiisoli]GCF07203.1 hypothetical protein KDI_07670 [Dictyobacter arantiisoli]
MEETEMGATTPSTTPSQEYDNIYGPLPPPPPPAAHPYVWTHLWSILLVICLAGGFLWLNLQQRQTALLASQQEQATQRGIATEQQRETILQNYMNKMTDLMINNQLLKNHSRADSAKLAADALTRETLSRLDADRKAILMRFLFQTRLISNDSDAIDLQDVDISQAHMGQIDIRDTTLTGANLSATDLHGATLSNAILVFTNLSHANLAKADLHACDMHNTNLSGANLRDVTGLTTDQINRAGSLKGATMPDGTVHN